MSTPKNGDVRLDECLSCERCGDTDDLCSTKTYRDGVWWGPDHEAIICWRCLTIEERSTS